MSIHIIEDNDLQKIVEAIKEKNNITTFKGSDMAAEIKKQPKVRGMIGGSVYEDFDEITAEELEGLTQIRSYGFYDCRWLKKITIPEGITALGNNTFNQCINLREVILPSSVKSTGTAGFNNCFNLKKINVERFTSVGTSGFRYCSGLTEIVFEDLLFIGATAFDACSKLESLVIKRGKVCTLANVNALTNTPIASGDGYIYVLDNLVDDYKAAENWVKYANQIKPVSEWEAAAE